MANGSRRSAPFFRQLKHVNCGRSSVDIRKTNEGLFREETKEGF